MAGRITSVKDRKVTVYAPNKYSKPALTIALANPLSAGTSAKRSRHTGSRTAHSKRAEEEDEASKSPESPEK